MGHKAISIIKNYQKFPISANYYRWNCDSKKISIFLSFCLLVFPFTQSILHTIVQARNILLRYGTKTTKEKHVEGHEWYLNNDRGINDVHGISTPPHPLSVTIYFNGMLQYPRLNPFLVSHLNLWRHLQKTFTKIAKKILWESAKKKT